MSLPVLPNVGCFVHGFLARSSRARDEVCVMMLLAAIPKESCSVYSTTLKTAKTSKPSRVCPAVCPSRRAGSQAWEAPVVKKASR